MNSLHSRHIFWILIIPIVIPALGIGVFAGFFFGRYTRAPDTPVLFGAYDEIHADNTNYHFISPLLSCTDGNLGNLASGDAATLHTNLLNLISSSTQAGDVSQVAIYFRQFNDGSWIDINGSTNFVPGSLLKVPVVMSVLNYAENTPGFMQTKITFNGTPLTNEQYFAPQKTITYGDQYTIPELIQATLVYSDNNAANLLANSIDWNELMNSFSDLGIQNPSPNIDAEISVDKYASFFRILYNATYLNRADSEYVLETMSKSTFTQGLVAGVPAGTVVAHKFGEREEGNVDQLHDCGIIYYPGNPYLLCVMTRGSNYDDLASVIAQISQTVYASIASIQK